MSNTVVSNHFYSIKNFYFRLPNHMILIECQSLDFRCQCTQRKLQSISAVLKLLNLKDFFTFSVKNRYQLNYFICIKDFNAQAITSLKLKLFYFFIYCCQHCERKTTCLDIFLLSAVFLASPYYNITYNLPYLRLCYFDVVTVIA